MRKARLLYLIGASAWLVACVDGVGPPTGEDGAPHFLRWAVSDQPIRFVAQRVGTGLAERPIFFSASAAPTLDTHNVSFWAVRGAERGIVINYAAADGSWQPYLTLIIPADALAERPDGTTFAAGDSVLIALTVDPQTLTVSLEPTGLTFSAVQPARLEFSYTGANPDYDGNGVVDGNDGLIENTRLDVWVQDDSSDPWLTMSADHATSAKLFLAPLRHFSGYAVSW